MDPELAWAVRAQIYDHIVATGRPPTVSEVAATAKISPAETAAVFAWLDEHHALVLDGDRTTIRIANPFSGVPTGFRVESGGQSYWANCAWDAVGVPAALHQDATIDAQLSDDGSRIEIVVAGGALHHRDELVHFPLPFASWYEDLIHT